MGQNENISLPLQEMRVKITSEEVELREKICEYLGESLVSVRVYLTGRTYYVSVKYSDFKPVREVKNTIEAMHDDVVVQDIDRVFSHDAKMQALMDYYHRDETIYIMCGENEVRPISFALLIEEELRHKTV